MPTLKSVLLFSSFFFSGLGFSTPEKNTLEDRTLFRISDKAYLYSEVMKLGDELDKFHCALGDSGVIITFLSLSKNDLKSWKQLKVSQIDKSYLVFFEKILFTKKLLNYVADQRVVVSNQVWKFAETALRNCSVEMNKDWKLIWGDYLRAELFVKSFRLRESAGAGKEWKSQLKNLINNRYSHKWMGPFREVL